VAKELEASQDTDLEELGILDHDGFGDFTNGLESLAQSKGDSKDKGKGKENSKTKSDEKGKSKNKGKSNKSVNQYANWWDDETKKKDKKVTDTTPDHIKNNPVYQDMIDRFMPQFFKDKALTAEENKGKYNHSNVNEIDDTKEREGVYPN